MSDKNEKVKVIGKDEVHTIPSSAPIYSSRDSVIMSGYAPSSETFYPPGSALLPEDEITFDNYKSFFGEKVDIDFLNDLDEIETEEIEDEEKINMLKKKFFERLKKYILVKTLNLISEKIFLTAIGIMIFSIPFAIIIYNLNSNLIDILKFFSNDILILYYLILVIIFLFGCFATFSLQLVMEDYQLKLDFIKLKLHKIMKKEDE